MGIKLKIDSLLEANKRRKRLYSLHSTYKNNNRKSTTEIFLKYPRKVIKCNKKLLTEDLKNSSIQDNSKNKN